jgi:hypothetical protein
VNEAYFDGCLGVNNLPGIQSMILQGLQNLPSDSGQTFEG